MMFLRDNFTPLLASLIFPVLTFSQNMNNSIGVITLSDSFCDSNRAIEVLNEDGSIWKSFIYSCYDEPMQKSEIDLSQELDILQFGVIGSPLLKIRCLEESDSLYKIVIHENNPSIKYLRKSNLFILESWSDYTLSCSAVIFNVETNPPRENIDGNIIDFSINRATLFIPKLISGNWLQIEWTTYENNTDIEYSGWIKWKEENSIVIHLLFLV